jgi:hypothetical protein
LLAQENVPTRDRAARCRLRRKVFGPFGADCPFDCCRFGPGFGLHASALGVRQPTITSNPRNPLPKSSLLFGRLVGLSSRADKVADPRRDTRSGRQARKYKSS